MKIEDPDQQETLFNLLEDNLIDNAENGTQATNAEVVAAKDSWTKLKAKLKFFYDIDLLQSQARTKLRHIKQNNRIAKQLLVDILELWKLAEYAEDDEQILTILLLALRDPQVKLQYELSLLKTSTTWTLENVIEYADTFAANKPKLFQADPSVKKASSRGGGGGGRGFGRGSRRPFGGSFGNRNQSSAKLVDTFTIKTLIALL